MLINMLMSKKLLLVLAAIAFVFLFILTIFLFTNRQSIRSIATAAPNCPSGTQHLFTSSTNLRVGSTVALGGKIESLSGNPKMENRDGVPLVQYVPAMKVSFLNQVVLDSALIFDNDPKKGEKPWSINGVSLPPSGQGSWGPLFKLNLTTDLMSFDNGGDSSHINICVKNTSSPPSPTPTPKPSNTPSPTKAITPTKSPTPIPTSTPTPTLTPTETPIPTITPTPGICPLPNAVTDIKITCEACQQK